MASSIYKSTATKSKRGVVFAFGRDERLDGADKSKGGYVVWKLCENYAGHVHGGIAKTWRYVEKDMSFSDAVTLMNRRLGYKGFNA